MGSHKLQYGNMASDRPARSNRGSKLQELLKFSKEGIALPEDDFYAALDDDSSGYNEYDSSSEEDEVDSDFDDKEEKVDEAVAAQEAEAAAREADKGGKRKTPTYIDPAKKKQSTAK